jgi:hypothetical protein
MGTTYVTPLMRKFGDTKRWIIDGISLGHPEFLLLFILKQVLASSLDGFGVLKKVLYKPFDLAQFRQLRKPDIVFSVIGYFSWR